MRKVLAISLVLLVAIVATAAIARAKEIEKPVPMLHDPLTQTQSGVFGVAQGADTFYMGGTIWDAGDGQWEADVPAAAGWANRKMWSFDAGGFAGTPHSGQPMDGWKGVDFTADVNDYFNVEDNTTIGACATSKVLFCGLTNAECTNACYSDLTGTGYGNGWNQMVVTPSATHNAGDALTLTYDYANESEPGYDFSYVILQTYDTVGGTWIDLATLATYDDLVSGTEGPIDLASYMTGGEQWRILFQFQSDGGWSDEDGWNPTVCGAVAFDNVVVAGTTTNWSENFEGTALNGLPAGWSKYLLGCGDYFLVKHIDELTTPISLDPCIAAGIPNWCSIAGSLLVAYDPGDPSYPHPLCQDNYVESPIVDFSSYPGLPGRYLVRERFGDLPLNDHIFMYWQVKYQPGCAAGGWSPWQTDNYVYYTREGASCANWTDDVSAYVPPTAQKSQIGLGVLNLCDEDPWALGCTYTCNESPYYDNITFGVFGDPDAPFIVMRELDYWQDQFAEDGSLNPTSTIDTRSPNYLSDLVPPIFGDTLVCRGAADAMACDFVFRMAIVGPQQPVVHPFFTTWFPTATTGAWQSARMDTAEVTSSDGTYTNAISNWYMTCFHESDPIAIANGLPEGTEILPNQLFTPGTRIEYFVKSYYTATPAIFFSIPDTTGGVYEEFEALPMMVTAGETVAWPCMIIADHFGQRGNWFERNSDRIERHLATLGYEYDMFNKLGPSSDLRNGIGRWAANAGQIGGPGTPKYNWGPGATLAQFVGYKHCVLNAGNIYGYSIYQADTDMFTSWMVYLSGPSHLRTLWVSGAQIARELNRRSPWGPAFLNTVLCVTYVNWSYSDTYNDFTYCLPMNGLTGNLGYGGTYYIRMNGCPRRNTEIAVSGAGGCNASAEVEYDSQGPSALAGISNVVALGTPNYKTYTEGYDFCTIRDSDALYPGSLNCGPDTFIATWMQTVLLWFGCTTSECGPGTVVSVTDPVTPKPAIVTALGQAFPNPMNPTATIRFSIGAPGRAMLRIFDVSGRVIRTLVDENMPAGDYQRTWDGKNDRGDRVASGVFFYQLDAPGFSSAKKIVILQ